MSFFRSPRPRIEEPRQRFAYAPLTNTKDIRLVKVPPGYDGKVREDAPQLCIEHVSLAASPSYTAISYMWGSPHEVEDLIIDHRALGLQANLRPMIQALSSPTQSRYFWIDAICINQEDNRERGHQVMQMGEIYSKANEVIAYLSGKNHRSYTSAYRLGRSRKSLSLYSTVAAIHHAAVYNYLDPLRLEQDAKRFFENDYFSRRWIIQEIGLARSVTIHCDGYEFPMGMLQQYFNTPSATYTSSPAARLCQLRQQTSMNMSPLEDLLYNNAHAMCSNPRDRIYALLSLTSTAQHHLTVDYNIQPAELLISVLQVCSTYEMLPRSRTLSLACFLRRQLSISSSALGLSLEDQIASGTEQADRPFYVSVCVRTVLESRRIDARVEDYIHRLRPSLPSFYHYKRILLQPAVVHDDDIRLEFTPMPLGRVEDLRGVKVESSNQWAFSFSPPTTGIRPPPYDQDVLAGLSSGAIELNDEVWQFPRTPVAVIARKTRQGYELIARALVLKINNNGLSMIKESSKSPRTLKGDGGLELERILDWPKGGDNEEGFIRRQTVAVTARDLLRLMMWVDFDNDW